ncbi:EamA family transporter RarD [Desulfotignum phosphitoxidans]|jgi:chloramphenicol-sensitive protein RarD|uniref:Multi-pass membrane protein RarD n=1 Tax=Desulfotignum phosphitoxidans DSM 13687 TaxID=1286635 RepID=S0G4N2_9BACT|nr:EamA family transporter RarD [Desulfotignum phosphitoxidans]EMS79342.1 multi-pass membrane protein RarD [Desulfotignum phosphitoxidans DSM 13687]
MNPSLSGVLFGLAAFASWGFLPAYWKQMQAAQPFEILCHRIVWSCAFVFVILFVQKRGKEVVQVFKSPAQVKGLAISSTLIAANWFVYIWAVNSGRVLETSLGYYINPMINVLLGFVLLNETFTRMQCISLGFALTGVIYSLLAYGKLPLFGLTLAISFAFYGYCRKRIQVAPLPGLFVETLILMVPALAYILFLMGKGDSLFFKDPGLTLWMIGAGVVTSLPLLWFAAAAKRLKLSTIGILQYLAPSIAFTLGVFVYKEPFSIHSLVTFAFIWAGVALYTLEFVKHHHPRETGRGAAAGREQDRM